MRVYLADIDLAIDVSLCNGRPLIELFIRSGTTAILGRITPEESASLGTLFTGAAEIARLDGSKQ